MWEEQEEEAEETMTAAEEEAAAATTRGEGHLQTLEKETASTTAAEILIIEEEEEMTHQNLRRGEEETIAAAAMEGEIIEIAGAHRHLLHHRETVAAAMTKTAAVEAAEQAHWAEAELLRNPCNQEVSIVRTSSEGFLITLNGHSSSKMTGRV